MHRVYVDSVVDGRAVVTDKGQLHHLIDVLRLKAGDAVSLSDGPGNDYTAVIKSVGKNEVLFDAALVRAARQSVVKLTVACAIPKNTRFDDVVDFLTQLGVERVIPMRTERVVVKLDDYGAAQKYERWRKIAQSAAQQSRRSLVPEVTPVTDFKDVIAQSKDYRLKLIPHLSGERKHIRDVVASSKAESVIVLIGPEGDFTPEEVSLALENGFIPVSLGDTVLRVAAAAIAVASYIRFTAGD